MIWLQLHCIGHCSKNIKCILSFSILFYTTPQSIELSNIMERTHSQKVIEEPAEETYHFTFFVFVTICMIWWPGAVHDLDHRSNKKIWVLSCSMLPLLSELSHPISWKGLIFLKLLKNQLWKHIISILCECDTTWYGDL